MSAASLLLAPSTYNTSSTTLFVAFLLSSRNSKPELRRREDENPPLPAPPVADERKKLRDALFNIDCPHGDMTKGRNLIVSIDGTSNQFSKTLDLESTNVVELSSRLIRDEKQHVYYDSGIGTYARRTLSWSYIKQVADHKIDTAIAWNFEKIVHAAYRWISENYQPGDRIYLFGFSRGAYQVRVIAGMIEKVGLLYKGNIRQIPFAYELYCAATSDSQRNPLETQVQSQETNKATTSTGGATANAGDTQMDTEGRLKRVRALWSKFKSKLRQHNNEPGANDETELCRQFQKSFCHDKFKVHFVGVWDTVSSIGLFRGKSLPETITGMTHVCHFRHALALDERRVKFQPEYANGGLGPVTPDILTRRGDVKEVWFAGSHSDMVRRGGGNKTNVLLNNFGPSLRWMTYEAMACGLRIKPYFGKWKPVNPRESLKGFWRALEWLPFHTLSYRDVDSLTWKPHLGATRIIQRGQQIHESVFTTSLSHQREASTCPAPRDSYNSGPDDSSSRRLITSIQHIWTHRSNSKGTSEYQPRAVFYNDPNCPKWTDLFRPSDVESQATRVPKSRNLTLIEQDPYVNSSHVLNALAQSCLSLLPTNESETNVPSADQVSRYRTNIVTLRYFLKDGARKGTLESLAEVPTAGDTLLKAVAVAVRVPAATDPEKPLEVKETLIRLLSQVLLSQARDVLTTCRLLPVSEVYQWGSNIPKYRENFLRVLQPFACIEHNTVPKKDFAFELVDNLAFSQTISSSQVIFTSISSVSQPTRTAARIWDLSTQNAEQIIGTQQGLSCMTRDGSLLAAWKEREVSIVDLKKKATLGNSSGDSTGYVKLRRQREADRQWEVFRWIKASDDIIYSLAFSSDGSRLVLDAEPLKVWTLVTDELLELDDSRRSGAFECRPVEGWIASGSFSGVVKIWGRDGGGSCALF
ncbi:hypothetical protein ONZ45_g11594 [Pleurotus djamor]|nr:hypothetical protein ONZ45_g11594 [Pleurotus djamor]